MIDTFFNALRKVVITTIFVMFAAAMVYVPQPQAGGGYHNVGVVEAGGVIPSPTDIANLFQNTLTAVQTAISVAADQWLLVKEQYLDPLAWILKNGALGDMTASTVNWIRSGFDGSPRFVQNINGYLERESDEEVESFLDEILSGTSFLCSPFEFDVALTVAITTDFERERTQVECNISEAFEGSVDNFEDFLEGDFFSGGWDGWFNMVGNPNNTGYGSRLNAQVQARQLQADKREERRTILDWASGYLAVEDCRDVPTAGGSEEICSIQTPGDLMAQALPDALGTGQETLVVADEINEFIAGLLTNIASDALSNQGLLGGGGGFTPYSRAVDFEPDVREQIGIAEAGGEVSISSGSGGETTGTTDVGGNTDTSDQALVSMNERVAAQTDYLDTINGYITELDAFIANPRNPEDTTIVAGINLGQAESLRDRVTTLEPRARDIRDDYEDLADEYPNASVGRQQEIIAEQSQLTLQFNQLNLLSEAELNVYIPLWDDVLETDIPAPIFIPGRCVAEPDRSGCPCRVDPDSIECQESRDRNDDLLFP